MDEFCAIIAEEKIVQTIDDGKILQTKNNEFGLITSNFSMINFHLQRIFELLVLPPKRPI